MAQKADGNTDLANKLGISVTPYDTEAVIILEKRLV